MKCNDCGSKEYVSSSTRSDVCENCMALRGSLIEAMSAGTITREEFQGIQRVLASGDGKGAAAIRWALGMPEAETETDDPNSEESEVVF